MLQFATTTITEKLSQFIVGQEKAIGDIALAVCRNFEAFLRQEEKKQDNILLYGPTGSGKTEIARRISTVLQVPFVKVVISDYTLTGYKGRDPQEIVLADFRSKLKGWPEKIAERKKRFITYSKATQILKETNISPAGFIAALEFGASAVFFSEKEVMESLVKRYKGREDVLEEGVSAIKLIADEVEKGLSFEYEINEKEFEKRPFGIVFIDEIDKILQNETSGEKQSFYRPLQEFILTMVEGAVVTHEEHPPMDTSHITFVLAGAFQEHSVDELIPELKGRLNVKVSIRELEYEDYLKIARQQSIQVPEILLGKVVKLEEDVYEEIALICSELNAKEYLGARRIGEIVSRVNRAITAELSAHVSNEPLVIDRNFVRWAVSFEPIYDINRKPLALPVPEELRSLISNDESEKKAQKPLFTEPEKLKSRAKDTIFAELVKKQGEKIKKQNGKLTIIRLPFLDNPIPKELTYTNSEGKTVLEYLVEKGVIKKLETPEYKVLKKHLSPDILKRISKLLKISRTTDVEF